MRMRAFVLLLLAGTLVAQEKIRWQRVHTFEDAVVEMEEIKLSFGNFGRVRFRTVFDKPETLRGNPGLKYKTQIEDMELMCAQRQYRVTETILLDARGKVIWSFKADESSRWKSVGAGGMMEKLLVPACRMIAQKKM